MTTGPNVESVNPANASTSAKKHSYLFNDTTIGDAGKAITDSA